MRQTRAAKAWLMCVLIALSFGLRAAPVDNLYSVSVAVKDRTEANRKVAFSEGLSEVLIKVSGHPALLNQSITKQHMKTAEKLAESYSYRLEQSSLMLDIRYNESAVRALLHTLDAPVWGSQRPLLLMWVAIEDSGSRFLLGSGNIGEVAEAINQQAKRRGIPVALPLMDLEDVNRINASDVWGDFEDVILAASDRYPADGLWVGKLWKNPLNQWQSQWRLSVGGLDKLWQQTADELPELLQHAVDQMAYQLAERFAINKVQQALGQDKLRLQVVGINRVSDYAKVTAYLNGLAPIRQLILEEVGENQLVFEVDVSGSKADLMQAIRLSRAMVMHQPDSLQGVDSTLHYRWIP